MRGALAHGAGLVDGALALVVTTVHQVEGLAEDVGVGLVERARLPLVDQSVGVLGVGVGPLVRDHVVGGDPVAVVRRLPVPVGVGAADRRVVVDGVHPGALAVVAVAAEGVVVEPVGLSGGEHQVLLLAVQGSRERVALGPHQREVALGVGLEEPAVGTGGVVDEGVAVDHLAVVGVEEDHVAHVGLVGDLDGVDQLALAARHALGQAGAVDDEVGRDGLDPGGVGLAGVAGRRLGLDQPDRGLAGLGLAQRGVGVETLHGHELAVDRGQVALGVEVGLEHRAEDGHALVLLGVGDHGGAEASCAHALLHDLRARRAERLGVGVDVGAGLRDRGRAGAAGLPGQQVAGASGGPDEADLAGRALLGHGHAAVRLVAHLADQRTCVRCGGHRGRRCCRGDGGEARAHDGQGDALPENLHEMFPPSG